MSSQLTSREPSTQNVSAMLSSNTQSHQKTSHIDVQDFFELSPDLFSIASEDGHFLKVNSMWSKTLGYEPSELVTRPWIEFVHPDDRDGTIKAAEDMRAQDLIFFRNRYRHADGSYRWLSWRCKRWSVTGISHAVAREVTLIVKAQQSILKAKRHMETWIEVREKEREAVYGQLEQEVARRKKAEDILSDITTKFNRTNKELDQRFRELGALNTLFQNYLISAQAGIQAREQEAGLTELNYRLEDLVQNLDITMSLE